MLSPRWIRRALIRRPGPFPRRFPLMCAPRHWFRPPARPHAVRRDETGEHQHADRDTEDEPYHGPQRAAHAILAEGSGEVARIDAAGGQQRAQLAQTVGFDLAHALAAKRQPLADRLQGLLRNAFETEPPA
jgi:hypothetical protein